MASSLMASHTLGLRKPISFISHNRSTVALTFSSAHNRRLFLSKPNVLSFQASLKSPKLRISASASANSVIESPKIQNTSEDLLIGWTRTVTTLVATALIASKFLASRIMSFSVQLKGPLVTTVGPAFFAAAKDIPEARLSTPLNVVAGGMAKWLDIYSGVLMIRVLLSWFPNIPWETQPLCAIRDLCDPYLNLFRNLVPPVLGALDVSPIFAFIVLGAFGSILNGARMG